MAISASGRDCSPITRMIGASQAGRYNSTECLLCDSLIRRFEEGTKIGWEVWWKLS